MWYIYIYTNMNVYMYTYVCILINNIYECFKCPILKYNLESSKKFTAHRGQTTIILCKSEMYFIETIQQRYIERPTKCWLEYKLKTSPLSPSSRHRVSRGTESCYMMNENDRKEGRKERQEKNEERGGSTEVERKWWHFYFILFTWDLGFCGYLLLLSEC